MRVQRYRGEPERLRELTRRPGARERGELSARVAAILARVREEGDAALLALTRELDGVRLDGPAGLEVGRAERSAGAARCAAEARAAIERACEQIGRFHAAQRRADVDLAVSPGARCERRVLPIERVGLYVPGGSAPLFSTLLMTAVPARLAGCGLRVACTPPRPDGTVDPHVLFAAELCEVDRLFRLGGAQAIGALAYGTASVPAVDKVFGPGNAWVTEAKLQVAADPAGAALDLPAGPSEVLVVADADADAGFVAADLLSQAEHGPDSHVVLVTPSEELAEAARAELARQLEDLPRRRTAAAALERSLCVLVDDVDAALAFANAYAPEHLILQVARPRERAAAVRNAGSVFLGPWTPEAAGDYASGTNHVLPTHGYARGWSGLGLDAFQKTITFQELTPEGLLDLGPVVERLAALEGLDAHARAVDVRLRRLAAEAAAGEVER